MNNKYFFYKVEHDYGLAPNPFHGYCTLAVCKSKIRSNKNLKIGDWIIGISGVKIGSGKIIFAMKVEEKITFDEYWNDKRFENKKPVINGSLVQMYGDNFYHRKNGKWIQENSAHSKKKGFENKKHLERDTGGEYVLISQNFYYYGNNAPEVSKEAKKLFHNLRSYTYKDVPKKIIKEVMSIIKKDKVGIHGDPASWKDIASWREYLKWKDSLWK